MNSQTLKMLLAGFATGTLVVVAVACGSEEVDEPSPDDDPVASQVAPSPQPEPTTPPKPEPSPEPTEAPVASSDTQSESDPWGDDDADPFTVTSVVENGKRYEIMTILPKDAIRAIFSPNFFTTEEAINQYRDTDLVIGVSIGDEHRAYNVAYLSGHEIVNDVVGGKPIAVTW